MSKKTAEVVFDQPVFDKYIELVYSIANSAGVELLIVGGAPRELLLHRNPKDLDFLVIKGSAQTIPMQLHKLYGFFSPVLFEKFGTYRTGTHGEYNIEMEFIPIRSGTVKEDLLLRDFTINTFTMRRLSLFNYEVTDMLGKAFDALGKGIIQTPIDPENTIKDDPLRIMRAIRFSCTLGMNIDGQLKETAKKFAGLLNDAAVERIRDELFMILLSNNPSGGIKLMQELGAIDVVMPELLPMIGFDQRSPYHKDELFTHSLAVMDKTAPRIETRLAALFHDTGKPFSMQSSEAKVTYYGHQAKSAEMFNKFSNRLKLPHYIANTTEVLIKRHMVNYTPEWKEATVKKFIKNNYGMLEQLIDLYRADAGSLFDPEQALSGVDELENRIRQQKSEEIGKLESPLNGYEIQQLLGIPPGPKIGEIKKAVIDAILEGAVEPTKQSVSEFVKQRFAASAG